VATDWNRIRGERGWHTPFTNRNNAGTRERINNTQLMLDRGEIDDPAFVKLMKGLEKAVEVEDIGDVYYSPVVNKSKKGGYISADKIILAPEDRMHGGAQSPSTFRAILAQERFKRDGYTAFDLASIEPEIARITKLLRDEVDFNKSVKLIGNAGARGKRTDEQYLGVAASLLADTDRGYNRQTGIAFNGMPLDGGHLVAHSANPALSDEPTNLIMQSGYMNKAQAATEKKAKQLGREATDVELANGLLKSWIGRILDGEALLTDGMRKNSNQYNSVMSGINAKVV
jgi:hypothetical protein